MAENRKILIADDEPDILEILKFNLQEQGYEVLTASNGQEALDKAKSGKPELIILDVMMPMKTGVEVCKTLRSLPEFKNVLIIFLTALSDDNATIAGLESGADDYISKPISPKVLISKVNALFRRSESKDSAGIIDAGPLKIDREKYLVIHQGKEVSMARKEFELLALLASKPGKVFLRNEILNRIWGENVIVGDRTIDVHIRKIRQKLNIDCIHTIKGVGYKFEI
jgi:two-component system alkaline phosphatase synthesis response regulator PhoP